MPTNPPDLAALVAEGRRLRYELTQGSNFYRGHSWDRWVKFNATTLLDAAAQLAEVQAENERLRGLLLKYGDHRWKCDITRAIREQRELKGIRCNCGWKETYPCVLTSQPTTAT